jgi:hypothetical protein
MTWAMSDMRGRKVVEGEIAIQELHARHVLRLRSEQ